MTDRKEIAAYLIGIMFGGFIGAILALIFAPQSGLETQNLIRDRYIELRDEAVLASQTASYKSRMLVEHRPELTSSIVEAPEPSGTGGGRPG